MPRHTLDDLVQRQSLTLDAKVELARKRVKEWIEHWDGDVFVSYSGGKDSTVLLDIVRSVDKTVPGVFVDTGLEYPEIKAQVLATPNVTIVRPKMTFRQVLNTYGYPVVNRRVSKMLRWLQNPSEKNQRSRDLTLTGKFADGSKASRASILPKKFRYIQAAPFKISERCCDVMKKEPLQRYERESGRHPFIGLMAADSDQRERAWMTHGCNAFDGRHPYSMPLGVWTEQDVLRYLKATGLPYASVYGDIEEDPVGCLRCTGVRRTGCIFCAFGIDYEIRATGTHRFARLFITHPKLYAYCMNDLGMREILRFLKVQLPD